MDGFNEATDVADAGRAVVKENNIPKGAGALCTFAHGNPGRLVGIIAQQ
jgi:hypothetical protein